MKVTRLIFFSVLFLCSMKIYAQIEYETEYEIQYEAKYSLDSLNLDTKTEEMVYLFASSDFGVFMNYNEAKKEEIKAELERRFQASNSVDLSGVHKTSNFRGVFYKDRKESEVFVVESISGKEFKYKEQAVPLTWEITNETKEYLEYQVQKATTSFAGRDYEAWFTVEIPIHDGPYVFYGLPGLIVELYDTKEHYYFGLQSIEKLDASKTWELTDTKVISKKEFNEAKEKFNKQSLASRFPGMDVKITIKDDSGREMSEAEMRREHKKSAESKNNPIELE